MYLRLLSNHEQIKQHFYKSYLPFQRCLQPKSIFQLYRPIIIMLHQNNNQIIGKNYYEQVRTFSYKTKKEISQQANKQKQMQRIPKNEQIDKEKIEMQCKKEIKHYLNCLSKFNSGMLNKQSRWLNILLRLFGKKHKRQEEQNKVQQPCNSINFEAISLINKSFNNHSFLILLLSFRSMRPINQEKYFDVEVISLQGKIIYRKINLKNWQEIHTQIQKVKIYTNDILLLVENRAAIIDILRNDIELNNLINKFYDVEIVKLEKQIDKKELVQQQIQFHQFVSCILERHQLIRQSLRYQIEPNIQKTLQTDQLIALSIAHKIVQSMGIDPYRSIKGQIKPYQSFIVKIIEKENRTNQNKYTTTLSKDLHFPTNLQNAHHCWICKKIRGYISCMSCSITEGKSISLCLNCYQSHHKEFKQRTSHSKKQSQSILYKWENIDLQVELMTL